MATPERLSAERLSRQYSFGIFVLDVDGGFLRRNGPGGLEEVPLRPKSFEVLLYLVQRHGRLVAKDDLIQAVWRDTAIVDNTLAQCLVEIRRALGDEKQELIRTVARRGYMFAAPITTPVFEMPRPPAPSAPAAVGFKWTWAIALSALLLVAGFFAWGVWRTPAHTAPLRAVPLNSLPGVQRYPSFSRDGDRVAFTWTGSKQDNPDIYVQQIGSGPPLRLTSDPANDYNPVWSPDGQWIAFLRRQWEAGSSDLLLIPPLGGPERKLTQINIRDTYFLSPPYLTWCPDSKCLVVTDCPKADQPAALFVVSLDSGEKRQLTHPQFPATGDTNPAISPDGAWLVFRQHRNLPSGALYRLPLGPGIIAAGEPRPITATYLNTAYPAWTPDSKEIIFSAGGSLRRLSVAGDNAPTLLPLVGEYGIMPALSRPEAGRASRLIYVRRFQDSNIWRVQTSAPGVAASMPPAIAVSSTRQDSTPDLSPDGRRIALASNRSGEWEIWLTDPDGSNAVHLTSLNAESGAPRWSPDQKWIVFQSHPEGQGDIFLVPATGGKPRNLTSHPANDGRPSFSSDGKWIYFSSNRSGERRIWKMPVTGGESVQVSPNAGFAAFESADGDYVYYNSVMEKPGPVWRVPTAGGAPEKVFDGVVLGAFVVLDRGIYFINRPSGDGGMLHIDQPLGETRLKYFDLATRKSFTVAHNLGDVFLGLTASRDGGTIFYSRVDSSMDDLMVVENFR